ncbi:MAG: hypothetical protein O2960_09045 [Verrucomicrobia bacterium]|nr:hypothetical protein [Verrucomicrobiota bacterium]
MNETSTDWKEIEPLLDEGMHSLDESDRAAVLVSSKVTKDPASSENITVNLDNYVGQFETTDRKIEIERQGNGIAVNIDGNLAFVAYPKSADKFASHDHNSRTEMTFLRDNSGRATQFALVRDGQELGDVKRTGQ